jgi:hypothetical protein
MIADGAIGLLLFHEMGLLLADAVIKTEGWMEPFFPAVRTLEPVSELRLALRKKGVLPEHS